MADNLDYKSILKSLDYYYSEKMNEWELEFMESMMTGDWKFTEKQKDKIIELNRKYRCQR